MQQEVSELIQRMDKIIKFCLDNMGNEPTLKTQAEFDALFGSFQDKLDEAREKTGKDKWELNELVENKCVKVPESKLNQFEKWFSDRVQTMNLNVTERMVN